jgi:hypothetical protein
MSKARRALIATLIVSALGGMAFGAQDRYTVSVPDGLPFASFRGYESWQFVAPSQTENGIKVIAANEAMIAAYKAGIPGNGQAFPDGAKIAKIEWVRQSNPVSQYPVMVPGALKSVSFIEKDSKKFPATGGWGYAQFAYDPVSDSFKPTVTGTGCGHTCHSAVTSHDYIFTQFPTR